MPKYHLNKKGEPGVCQAMVACPFGDLDSDHFPSVEEARAAYEAKQASFTAPHARWKPGKKLRTADLKGLPSGSVVQWPSYSSSGRTYSDYVKLESGQWRLADDEQGRSIESFYLGGAGGNEPATFVSADGARTADLPPEEEPKAARKSPEPKWAIIRVSNVSGKVYLAHEFAREASAQKKLAELNKYDYLHHSYQLVSMEEAKARTSG